jgi:hypothetical protein
LTKTGKCISPQQGRCQYFVSCRRSRDVRTTQSRWPTRWPTLCVRVSENENKSIVFRIRALHKTTSQSTCSVAGQWCMLERQASQGPPAGTHTLTRSAEAGVGRPRPLGVGVTPHRCCLILSCRHRSEQGFTVFSIAATQPSRRHWWSEAGTWTQWSPAQAVLVRGESYSLCLICSQHQQWPTA